MKESLKDPCTCDHPRGIHDGSGCWGFGLTGPNCLKKCKSFKLDNLKLVEDLAKERKLI